MDRGAWGTMIQRVGHNWSDLTGGSQNLCLRKCSQRVRYDWSDTVRIPFSLKKKRWKIKTKEQLQTSLVAQWLSLQASAAGGTGSIPGRGRCTCHAVWPKRKTKPTNHANKSGPQYLCIPGIATEHRVFPWTSVFVSRKGKDSSGF